MLNMGRNVSKMAGLTMVAAIVTAVLLSACASTSAPSRTEVMVFAAMSLKQPFTRAAMLFEEENPGTVLKFNYSSSGTLAAQIESGASADVFASAGGKEMDLLSERGLIDVETRKVFAVNSLVLVAPLNHVKALQGFHDLVLTEVRRIAVCDRRLSPAGLYADEVMKYYGIGDNISGKLITCAQVAQVCDYTVRGEVDAGVVYLSDYLARKGELALIAEAPSAAHSRIEYPIAVMKKSLNKDYANRFVSFICSERCVKILSGYGFKTASAGN